MPLTTEQKDNIEAFLHDKAEAVGAQLGVDNFTQLLYDNWDDVINPTRMARRTKRRALRVLRRERDRQDTDRPGLDAEIAALEAELGP